MKIPYYKLCYGKWRINGHIIEKAEQPKSNSNEAKPSPKRISKNDQE